MHTNEVPSMRPKGLKSILIFKNYDKCSLPPVIVFQNYKLSFCVEMAICFHL